MHKLERFLRPKSIAVIGGLAATVVVEQSIELGYSGDVWPVHPKKDEVAGVRAYRSVADL
ncbi:CoA-binding protein, partial [Mesorhizobium sp. M0027]|uniref:CoA-binding protein n=1 Tax=Mesorhizobium sp. M0027 TaxID=2956848 RepID=UPI0033355E9B